MKLLLSGEPTEREWYTIACKRRGNREASEGCLGSLSMNRGVPHLFKTHKRLPLVILGQKHTTKDRDTDHDAANQVNFAVFGTYCLLRACIQSRAQVGQGSFFPFALSWHFYANEAAGQLSRLHIPWERKKLTGWLTAPSLCSHRRSDIVLLRMSLESSWTTRSANTRQASAQRHTQNSMPRG